MIAATVRNCAPKLKSRWRSRAVTPGAEWLVDNFHLVEEQLREIREDLPPGFYRELPKLADGPFAGYPRVYLLARELIEHTAGRIDLDAIVEFVLAYQRTSTLSIGETWAIPLMVRLALVEGGQHHCRLGLHSTPLILQLAQPTDQLVAGVDRDQVALGRRPDQQGLDVGLGRVHVDHFSAQYASAMPEAFGLIEQRLDEIFERFYSERPEGEKFGTHSGLGLSISVQLVRLMGGLLWAESEPNQGSTFHFTVTVDARATPADGVASGSAHAEGDDAAGGIVRRYADGDAVARHHLDAEPPHAPAQLRKHFLARVTLHAIEPAGADDHERQREKTGFQ